MPITVRGQKATLDAAVREAAKLLAASRLPVIAGLGTCGPGAAAAAKLAEACGGVLDHAHGAALLRDLGAMREYGWIVAAPLLARARADTVLLAGPGLDGVRLPPAPTLEPGTERRVFRFAPPDGELLAQLGVLRALAAGRPIAEGADPNGGLARLADALRAARYGVAAWNAEATGEMEIEALCGLVSDLNATTRWAGLPLAPPGNAMGVAQALARQTGFPVRIGFVRGRAEHDPWRFDAARLVASGEADAAVWVQALAPEGLPPWGNKVPLIALVAQDAWFAEPPQVAITVGRPGVDHDAVLWNGDVGALVAVRATAPSDAPRVAAVLGALTDALQGGASC